VKFELSTEKGFCSPTIGNCAVNDENTELVSVTTRYDSYRYTLLTVPSEVSDGVVRVIVRERRPLRRRAGANVREILSTGAVRING
jgi:hypothetical protein